MSRRRTVDITDQQRKAINDIIDKYKDVQGALIPTLHDVQEYFGYLPIEVQKIVSEGLGIPLAEIYGVVTFYTQFSTQPKGQYTVSVCLGTACYVKGSGKILEKFEENSGNQSRRSYGRRYVRYRSVPVRGSLRSGACRYDQRRGLRTSRSGRCSGHLRQVYQRVEPWSICRCI